MSEIIGDVIIIDDESGVSDVLEMYCENLGCFRKVIKAHDGSDASKKLRNQEFALILLDINMPKKSGVDIVKEIQDKYHPNSIKDIIVISGELSKAVITEAMQSGVKNFLVKPFDEDQFTEKVKPILKLS